MKLYYRFSEDHEPLLEVRTDYASPDGRTIQGRPYVRFASLENGVMQKRLKSMPMSAEEACAFVEEFKEHLLAISGTVDAIEGFHEFFQGCGFGVRSNRGRAWRPPVEPVPVVQETPVLAEGRVA